MFSLLAMSACFCASATVPCLGSHFEWNPEMSKSVFSSGVLVWRCSLASACSTIWDKGDDKDLSSREAAANTEPQLSLLAALGSGSPSGMQIGQRIIWESTVTSSLQTEAHLGSRILGQNAPGFQEEIGLLFDQLRPWIYR